ncbi:MAG: choice-of-anchor B family protein [Vicinamibacteria bacterium]
MRGLVVGKLVRLSILFAFPAVAFAQPVADARCEEGRAAGYPCDRVHLLAYLPLESMGTTDRANDVWGWAEGGREFVLLGRENGTSFIEITNPLAPVYLGRLPSHGRRSIWRDVETYRKHAFVVSEAFEHGLQVFDLGALLSAAVPPVEFAETAHYAAEGLGGAHTLSINETSGFAYVSGSDTCFGGLHMVDISVPVEPRFAGCFGGDGYTHDVQCVSYDGPDRDLSEARDLLRRNEDTLTIVDVTEKSSPRLVSRTSYEGVGYVHQTWATADRLFLLMDDELDEEYFGHDTKTWIWDIADLDRPLLVGAHLGDTAAIDHNLYIRDHFVYQANYRAGLRILKLDPIAEGRLEPAGYFDVYPADDAPEFNGAWSAYPFFPSGVVAVSGIEQGLFLLKPELP